VLWRIMDRVAGALMTRAEADRTAQSFVRTVLKYVVLTIAVVSALSQVGINTGSMLASLGVAGLTLGFAAKDTLSNLISGLFIFWDRPFVIGDLVEIDGNYGRVDIITMRSTRVVTVDGKMLAIPNATIVNSIVKSYTNFPHLRLDIPYTIGVDEDYAEVTRIMLEVAGRHPQCMGDPPPRAVMKVVNDYNVEIELQMWIDDEKQHTDVRFEIRRAVYEALRSAKVVMPYETLQLVGGS
jgi:small conductance mechanosensitive channel